MQVLVAWIFPSAKWERPEFVSQPIIGHWKRYGIYIAIKHFDSCLWRAWPDRQQEPIWFDLFPPSLPWPAIGWQVSKNQQKKQKNKYWYFQEETINRGSQSGPRVDTWWRASLPLSGQEEKHFFLQLISFLRLWHNSSTKFEYEYEDIFLLFLQLQVQVEQLCFTCYSY